MENNPLSLWERLLLFFIKKKIVTIDWSNGTDYTVKTIWKKIGKKTIVISQQFIPPKKESRL